MADIARKLLTWYDVHARALPWRVPPGSGDQPDPYRIWLSEVMLQQTTVAAVIPYYKAFLKRWPTVGALARSPLEDVLAAWAGLGYYSRARNLHACALAVAEENGGVFPKTEEGLRALPGIGAYTAAAIAAIAHGRRAVVVDGNVERVMARLHGVETPLPDAKPELARLAAKLTPAARCGDYAQAVMDLGATVCTPRSPECGRCPVSRSCVALSQGLTETLPAKRPKGPKPLRKGIVFWITRPDGAVLVRPRPARGLLARMPEFPSLGWNTKSEVPPEVPKDAPFQAAWTRHPARVTHTFTHFHLELTIHEAEAPASAIRHLEGRWVEPERLGEIGLPTVMRKVADAMTGADGPLFQKAAAR